MPPTRRSFLHRVAAGLSVGTGSALAGCSFAGGDGPRRTPYDVPEREQAGTTTPDPDDVVDFGAVDYPDPGPPTYRRWLPAPSALVDARVGAGSGGANETERNDLDGTDAGYPVRFADVGRVRSFGDAVPGSFDYHRRVGRFGLDHFGIGFEWVSRVLRVGPSTRGTAVVEAAFDRAGVAATLLDTGYERVGEYRSFDLFARPDDPRAVGLGDDALVWSDPGVGPAVEADAERIARRVVRTFVDARTENVARYHEVNRGLERVTDAVGAPAWAWFVTDERLLRALGSNDEFGDLAAYGTTLDMDRSASYWRSAYAFDHATDRPRVREALRERVARDERARRAETVSVAVEPFVAQVTGSVPLDRHDAAFGRAGTDAYPQVTWGFDHEELEVDTRVTVTHRGGDLLSAERLGVHARGRTLREFDDRYETVGPGDALSTRLVTGDESGPTDVLVVWEVENDRMPLGRYVVP